MFPFFWQLLLYLLGQGAVVSMVVDALKKIEWVSKHPKLAAAILNTIAVAVATLALGLPVQFVDFILEVAAAFAASVGFYQVKKDALSSGT